MLHRLIAAALAAGALLCAPTHANAQNLGLIGPGHVIGNGTSTNPGAATDYSLLSVLGQQCTSAGAFMVSTGGGAAQCSPVAGSNTTINGTLNLSGALTYGGVTLNNAVTGTGNMVLSTSPTIASPTFSGTVAGAGTIPNAVLQNSSITIGSTATALGGTLTSATGRGPNALNIDQLTTHGDSIYTILATDRVVGTSAAFTASRTWTLPAANALNAGQRVVVADYAGGVTATNTLVISRAGSDTINGAGTAVTISAANGAYECFSDGTSKWSCQSMGAASGGGVSSVTAGTGLSGGTITTSGTIAVSLSQVNNSLGGNVSLNNTGTYFDGPSVAQGTSGTWLATGTVTLVDTGGSAQFFCKLWDGTTIIANTSVFTGAANAPGSVALSGYLATPAANIRISCKDVAATTGAIVATEDGTTKASTLSAIRIN